MADVVGVTTLTLEGAQRIIDANMSSASSLDVPVCTR